MAEESGSLRVHHFGATANAVMVAVQEVGVKLQGWLDQNPGVTVADLIPTLVQHTSLGTYTFFVLVLADR